MRNEEGIKIMDFATAYQMRLMNTYYKKGENHLVTYNSEEEDHILTSSC